MQHQTPTRCRPTSELPPAPLGTLVGLLRLMLRTSGLALFEVNAGELCCCYIDRSTDSRAERVWRGRRDELLGGAVVRADGAIYFPVVHFAQGRVVALLEAVAADEAALDDIGQAMLACALSVVPEALACLPRACDACESGRGCSRAGTRNPARGRAPLGHAVQIALEALERQRLVALLDSHAWVVSTVAQVLGVDRVTIYRKMSKLGIRRAQPSPNNPRRLGEGSRRIK